eukprot:3920684-Prymnesium_polylepis.2
MPFSVARLMNPATRRGRRGTLRSQAWWQCGRWRAPTEGETGHETWTGCGNARPAPHKGKALTVAGAALEGRAERIPRRHVSEQRGIQRQHVGL